MIKTISTKGMTSQEWRELRRKSIGGSDAAAIVGLNSYNSPVKVWLDKTGRLEDQPITEAMRQGTDLEEYVSQRFTEKTGIKVRRKNAIIYNDQYPFAHANIDRMIIGENAILECKTTSRLRLKHFSNGEYPANYYVQVMHYLAVTEAEKAYIAVLILQEGLHIYEVNRAEAEISALMAAEKEFWKYVQNDEAPPGYQETLSDGTSADLFGMQEAMRRYLQIKEQIKALEDEAGEIGNRIKSAMGAHETGRDGNYIAIWRNSSKSSFDHKLFMKDNPGIDFKPYMKNTTSRIFSVKEVTR